MNNIYSRSKSSYQISPHKPFPSHRSTLPDMNQTKTIEQLKLQCEYLLKDDNCFKALNPSGANVQLCSDVVSKPKQLRTHLRSLSRKKQIQEKHMRIGSCELEVRQQTKVSTMTSTPIQVVKIEYKKHLSSYVEEKFRCLKKNKQHMPILYRKGSMYFKSEPIKARAKIVNKKPQVKGFQRMVKELKAILMKS